MSQKTTALPFTESNAQWIWTAESDYSRPASHSPSHYETRLFRRSFPKPSALGDNIHLHISADTRFLLFLNGNFVGRGPCSGDVHHHYYETFDIPAADLEAENVLAVVVFDYSPVHCNPPHLGAPAAFPCHSGGLLLEVETAGEVFLKTDPSWKVTVDTAYHFHSEGNSFGAFIGYFEDLHLDALPAAWNQAGFDDQSWDDATELYPGTRLEKYIDAQGPYGLVQHEAKKPEENLIELDEREAPFLDGGSEPAAEWKAFLLENRALIIPPNTQQSVILPFAKEWTGFPRLSLNGGAGSTVRLRYAEALRLPKDTPEAVIFGADQSTEDVSIGWSDDSTGWTFDRRGQLSGYCDIIRPGGYAYLYEPHHFRTFKFIRIEVETGDEPLTLEQLEVTATGYPLENKAAFTSSDDTLNRVYDISWHTLRLSAHETYFDCPYYEQLQYVTDGYINMLNTLYATGDTLLPRQFIEQIGWSLNHEGLVWMRYPSRIPGFIPGQCLEWIASLHDYVLSSGDLEFAQAHQRHVHSILDFFHQRVGDYGLPQDLPWWNWIDWCPGWKRGVPPGADQGPVLSLCSKYALALAQAVALSEWTNDSARLDDYQTRQTQTLAAINDTFWNSETGRYAENIVDPTYASQLGNAFAVLAGAPDDAQKAQLKAAYLEDSMTSASYMGMFFIRLAWEALDSYSIEHLCAPYKEMIDYGLSTWAEDTCYWRSLCHGYSAHPIVDCITIILGIRILSPGATRVLAKPRIGDLDAASGSLTTPRGSITLSWQKKDNQIEIELIVPEGTEVELDLPGKSTTTKYAEGKHSMSIMNSV